MRHKTKHLDLVRILPRGHIQPNVLPDRQGFTPNMSKTNKQGSLKPLIYSMCRQIPKLRHNKCPFVFFVYILGSFRIYLGGAASYKRTVSHAHTNTHSQTQLQLQLQPVISNASNHALRSVLSPSLPPPTHLQSQRILLTDAQPQPEPHPRGCPSIIPSSHTPLPETPSAPRGAADGARPPRCTSCRPCCSGIRLR